MKIGMKGRQASAFVLALSMSLAGCKRDKEGDDCGKVPYDRLPEPSSAFSERRCEKVKIDDDSTDYARPLAQYGFVKVPLGPGSSEAIEIGVARVFTDSKNPKPDPIVYLDGGPGGPSIVNADWLHPLIREMSPDRDVIFIDQRGVGRSRPNLNCTETDDTLEEALTKCYKRLSQETDLDEFNTINNASDIDYIRQALGYEEWNLLGISYGTRLGLTVMRDYPEGVRSALIDSVVPLQGDVLAEIGKNGYASMVAVFEECAQSTACRGRYPDPMSQLSDLVVRLNEEPKELDVGLLSGDLFLRFVFELMYSPYTIAVVPKLIDDGAKDDFSVFERIEKQLSSGAPFSFGMHLSLHCAEEVPFSSREAFEAADATVPEEFRDSLSGSEYLQMCDYWPVAPAPASENEPVVSDVPTLVLSGEFDPVTPPAFAEAADQYLTNSTYFMIENESHGASLSACGIELAREFFDDPEGPIDGSCLARVPPIEFSSVSSRARFSPAGAEPIEFFTGDLTDEQVEEIGEQLERRLR